MIASGEVPSGAEDAVREMSSLDDTAPWRSVVDADQHFHRALVAGAGSPRLLRAYEAVESEVVLSMVARPQYSRAEHAVEHEDLLLLIRAGDVEAAEAGFIEHLRVAAANATSEHRRRHQSERDTDRGR